MPIFLDTRGRSKLAIAICARCSIKMSIDDLMPDPNAPGLLVCKDDLDELDPYRLPPAATEDVTLEWARPDVDIDTPGPTPVYTNQIDGIAQIQFTYTWQPLAAYLKGASITPQNVNDPNVTLPQYEFIALQAGTSDIAPPIWPTSPGVTVLDGSVIWLNYGIFPN